MKVLSEEQQEQIQKTAYEKRGSIQPRDLFAMQCIEADVEHCTFRMDSGRNLCCAQPYDRLKNELLEKVSPGEWVELYCTAVMIKANGYGRFVDYEFYSDRLNHHVVINGPDAQAMQIVSRYTWEK